MSRAISSSPVRVGLMPTPRAVTREPLDELRGDEEERRRREVARDRDLEGRHAPRPPRRIELDHRPDGAERHAEGARACARCGRARPWARLKRVAPVGREAREEDRALHLRARDRALVLERPERAALGQRADASGATISPGRRRVRPPLDDRAPRREGGPTTRIIGRRDRVSSPTSVARKRAAARTPQSRRIVVPELPQSSGRAGALRPAEPDAADDELRRTPAPRSRRPWRAGMRRWRRCPRRGRSRRSCVSPSQSAPKSSARWPMLLSEGTGTLPTSGCVAGWTTRVVIVRGRAGSVARARRACAAPARRQRRCSCTSWASGVTSKFCSAARRAEGRRRRAAGTERRHSARRLLRLRRRRRR